MNQRSWRGLALGLIASLAILGPGLAGEQAVTLAIEAEDFLHHGDWRVNLDKSGHSGRGFLFAGTTGAKLPAAGVVKVPRAGNYRLWVRSIDFPTYRPGTRLATFSVNGKRSEEVFGDSGSEDWTWEPGGSFDLPAGDVLLGLHDVSKGFARIDAVVLSNDPEFKPRGAVGNRILPQVRPIEPGGGGDPVRDLLAERKILAGKGDPFAVLENEEVRYSFLPATSDGKKTVAPTVEVRVGEEWRRVGVDPGAEIYSVVRCDGIEIGYSGTHPLWKRGEAEPVELKVGGARLTTARTIAPPEIWRAGEFIRFRPVSAKKLGDTVRIDFEKTPAGRMVAEWKLAPGKRAAQVRLVFVPAEAGEYSLGYHLFFRRPIGEVDEIQLPLAFQRKRLPEKACMVLDPRTPTPLSLAQVGKGEAARCWGLIGDPSEIPFAWPHRDKPNMGFCINDEEGKVQPAIYGPVPATEDARVEVGKTQEFCFNVLVQPGDWYGAYRTAADEVFGFRDYRRNVRVSLSDAVMNMIDLIKDDEFGGWWRDAKGWYQIESHNTVTHSAPATMLSLYRLTGDEDLYRRRVLPTMEYILSRGSVHFTPAPHDPGRYRTKPMGGPCSHYGSATYSALDMLSGGYTPAFGLLAFPEEEKVKRTVGYSHAGIFNEWAIRYRKTGDKADLDTAIKLADEYLAKTVLNPPTKPVGFGPFWLISFVPDWEGLLMMYELTGASRYLDGAAIGARQLMAGLWTQPAIPAGDTTIFPGGSYDGDPWRGSRLHRGPYKTRLGFPIGEDSLPEHPAPAWQVSCVGLGFEQPSTLGRGPNRLIYQAVWAPEFLRLARYTGDKAFEICARNATVGRWANYPGYYVAGHMDMVNDPAYPFVGPDQSTIYYHHIVPHISWTIDYLVSEAEALSDGKIAFPWLRENGYAFFDGRVYGHAPGRVFGEKDCWLWLQRGAVQVSNPQINTLTAYNGDKFFAILTNQDTKAQTARVSLSQQALGIDTEKTESVTVRTVGGASEMKLAAGMANLEFAPRQLLVLEVDGVDIDIAAHSVPPGAVRGDAPTSVVQKVGDVTVKAAAVAVAPGPWDALVWSSALPRQAKSVTLETKRGDGWEKEIDENYPFEFRVPMASAEEKLHFRVRWVRPDGEEQSIDESVLGSMQPGE